MSPSHPSPLVAVQLHMPQLHDLQIWFEKKVNYLLKQDRAPWSWSTVTRREKLLVYRDSSSKQGPLHASLIWRLSSVLWSPSSSQSHSSWAMHAALLEQVTKSLFLKWVFSVYSYLGKFGILKFVPGFMLPLNLSVQDNIIPLKLYSFLILHSIRQKPHLQEFLESAFVFPDEL